MHCAVNLFAVSQRSSCNGCRICHDVIRDTWKYDHCLLHLLHGELCWLSVSNRVQFSLLCWWGLGPQLTFLKLLRKIFEVLLFLRNDADFWNFCRKCLWNYRKIFQRRIGEGCTFSKLFWKNLVLMSSDVYIICVALLLNWQQVSKANWHLISLNDEVVYKLCFSSTCQDKKISKEFFHRKFWN